MSRYPVEVEANFMPAHKSDFPARISGKFLNRSDGDWMEIQSNPELDVYVNSRRFKFTSGQPDGTFTLRRDW
jgi:hypothetical protein